MLSKLVKYTTYYELLLVRIDPGSIHSRIGHQTVKFGGNSSDLSVKKCSEIFFVGPLWKSLLWELFFWEQFQNYCSQNFSERAEEDLIGLKKTQSEWEQSHCSEQNERPLTEAGFKNDETILFSDLLFIICNHYWSSFENLSKSKYFPTRGFNVYDTYVKTYHFNLQFFDFPYTGTTPQIGPRLTIQSYFRKAIWRCNWNAFKKSFWYVCRWCPILQFDFYKCWTKGEFQTLKNFVVQNRQSRNFF